MNFTTPNAFGGRVAVVTGAGGGIGMAIARALAEGGAIVYLVGRRQLSLETLRAEIVGAGHHAETCACDLSHDDDVHSLRDRLGTERGRVDILVHSAGTISLGTIETAPISDFDKQYGVNVRAPYLLTQALLPLVKLTQGEIVFINSSAGIHTKEQVGAYAASKHALRAFADTLRMEVNAFGMRVLSVYPGNTATAMQDTIQDHTGRKLENQYLLQPEDIASSVIHALLLPRTAEVTDIQIRPFRKAPA